MNDADSLLSIYLRHFQYKYSKNKYTSLFIHTVYEPGLKFSILQIT